MLEPQTETATHAVGARTYCKPQSVMAVLTFLGLVVAAFIGAIFWSQLNAVRTDQRAWVSLSAGKIRYDEIQPGQITVTVPITILNTGKTPAKHIESRFVVEKVQNGQSPRLQYDQGPVAFLRTGVALPNTPYSITAKLSELDSTDRTQAKIKVRALSDSEYQELIDGTAYIAVYGYCTYDDAFGKHRWHKYCLFDSPSHVLRDLTVQACLDYNAVDDN